MKKLIASLLLLVTFGASAGHLTCAEFDKMDYNQKRILKKSYEFGKKEGYEHTLAAIAWKESRAGEALHRRDIRGGSHGVFHNLLDNVLFREYGKRLSGKDAASPRLIRATKKRLKSDFNFAAKHAVLELQYWNERTWNLYYVWAAYNGGYNAFSTADNKRARDKSLDYADDILRRVYLVRTCKNSPVKGGR